MDMPWYALLVAIPLYFQSISTVAWVSCCRSPAGIRASAFRRPDPKYMRTNFCASHASIVCYAASRRCCDIEVSVNALVLTER